MWGAGPGENRLLDWRRWARSWTGSLKGFFMNCPQEVAGAGIVASNGGQPPGSFGGISARDLPGVPW